MDLNYVLKFCFTIIVFIFTVVLIMAFIDTLKEKIMYNYKKDKALKELDRFTNEFLKHVENEKKQKKRSNHKQKNKPTETKKKEDK